LDVIKWSFTGDPGEWRDLTKDSSASYGPPPPAVVDDGEAVVTFVNHSTFLIQTRELNILTDPIWSDRASPFQWIGPKRMRPPGIRFEDLPEIHVVLISHNHYDHLDLATVKRLDERYRPLFVTPLGVAQFLHQHGITHTLELDWWQEKKLNEEVTVAGVPAQHFSGRGLTDRDKTLWCGYVLETPGGSIYFAGDTGYDGFFKKIGQRYAPIDLALIPIGAFRPRWFMSPIHVSPEEAVLIHKDVQAVTSVGIHFGTFPMADDGMDEPAQELIRAREKYGVPDSNFVVMQEGSSEVFNLNKTGREVPRE
jgi:L-ascorbate metabolism protein UlaG (beta-lactamase superfamily)